MKDEIGEPEDCGLPDFGLTDPEYWGAWQAGPWLPPATLTAATICRFQEMPVIWLDDAVDILAFGELSPPKSIFETTARRQQASKALCNAARLGRVQALGNADREGDGSDSIPRAYFDVPRRLGSAKNVIETDFDHLSTAEFAAAEVKPHRKWFNVRIETGSFLAWLKEAGGHVPNEPVPVEDVPKGAKFSPAKASTEFKRWRNERGNNIPKFTEDCAHMKSFGVGRRWVIAEREKYPRLPRGKPKSK